MKAVLLGILTDYITYLMQVCKIITQAKYDKI